MASLRRSALLSRPSLRELEINACLAVVPAPIAAVPAPIPTYNLVPRAVIDFVRPLKGLPLEVLVLNTFLPLKVEVTCGAIYEIGRTFPKLRKLHLLHEVFIFTHQCWHGHGSILSQPL